MISFSQMDRIHACPASAALPRSQRSSSTGAASAGTARHAHIERIGNGATHADSIAAADPEHRDMVSAMQLDGLPVGAPYRHEVAVALDPVRMTVRELGQGINRRYEGMNPTEIPGTIDVIGGGERVQIVDWKGSHDVTLPRANVSRQMLLSALAGLLLHERDEAEVSHVHFRDDGSWWRDGPHALSLADLLQVAAETEADLARVAQLHALVDAGAEVPVSPGVHCRYCPAVLSCPDARRQWALVAAPATGAVSQAELDLAAMVARDPAAAYVAIKRAKSVVNSVEDVLVRYALECGPIDLGDGQHYGRHDVERTEIDGQIAFAVVQETLGVQAATEAVQIRASKAGITRAIKASNQGAALGWKSAADGERKILAAISQRGGLSTRTTQKVEAFRADSPPQVAGRSE